MTTRSTPHRAWQSEGSRLRSAPSGTEESSTPHANRTEARRRQHSEGGVLLALADWFLPTSVANGDPSALRRVRLTMAVGFFSGCGVSATLVVATEHPDSTTLRALTYSLAILLIAVPAIVKAGVPIRAIQHAIIALLVGYSLTLVGATGGIDGLQQEHLQHGAPEIGRIFLVVHGDAAIARLQPHSGHSILALTRGIGTPVLVELLNVNRSILRLFSQVTKVFQRLGLSRHGD